MYPNRSCRFASLGGKKGDYRQTWWNSDAILCVL